MPPGWSVSIRENVENGSGCLLDPRLHRGEGRDVEPPFVDRVESHHPDLVGHSDAMTGEGIQRAERKCVAEAEQREGSELDAVVEQSLHRGRSPPARLKCSTCANSGGSTPGSRRRSVRGGIRRIEAARSRWGQTFCTPTAAMRRLPFSMRWAVAYVAADVLSIPTWWTVGPTRDSACSPMTMRGVPEVRSGISSAVSRSGLITIPSSAGNPSPDIIESSAARLPPVWAGQRGRSVIAAARWR